MELIHYDSVVLITLGGDKTYELNNIYAHYKTRTIKNVDGFSLQIKTENIELSCKTYWHISGNYCQMFDGSDASCYLCGWVGMDYNKKCNCKKEQLTIENHRSNLTKCRNNYLRSIINSYFKDYNHLLELDLNNIDDILYSKGRYGERLLNFNFPSTFEFINDEKGIKRKKWKNKHIKYLNNLI